MAPIGLRLRPFRPDDFETLHHIDQACFPKGIAYGRYELRIYLQSEDAHCIVAEINETVVGFVLTERNREFAHIITLDVLEPYRHQSIGSRLLETAEEEAASCGARLIVLETATTNVPAIALWKKHGYRETGTRANYYGPGLNAFEMQKRLQPKSRVKAHP